MHLVGPVEDGAAGGLVHAPVLHAYQPVLHDVQQADVPLAPPSSLSLRMRSLAFIFTPSTAAGQPFSKFDGDIGGGVGGHGGGDPHLQEAGLVVLGLVGGVLQVQALVGQVPQVLVLGVAGLPADLQGTLWASA